MAIYAERSGRLRRESEQSHRVATMRHVAGEAGELDLLPVDRHVPSGLQRMAFRRKTAYRMRFPGDLRMTLEADPVHTLREQGFAVRRMRPVT